MSKNADEGLLSDVLCEPGITNDPQRESEQSTLVAAHKNKSGLVVTHCHS
jgi:hypothetical protein